MYELTQFMIDDELDKFYKDSKKDKEKVKLIIDLDLEETTEDKVDLPDMKIENKYKKPKVFKKFKKKDKRDLF